MSRIDPKQCVGCGGVKEHAADCPIMNAPRLDTSGEVAEPQWKTPPMITVGRPLRWRDLDPFTQGCLDRAARDWQADPAFMDRFYELHGTRQLAFSDLAPETLVRIIADCAAEDHFRSGPDATTTGRLAWADRQNGSDPHFAPLTVTLGDDGKVYLREAT